MPGDVLGTNLFNFQTNSFVLTKGPIFTRSSSSPTRSSASHLAQDPGRASASHERTCRHHRRHGLLLGRGFHGGSDAKPDRAAGHLSPARGAISTAFCSRSTSIIRAATRNATSCAVTVTVPLCRGLKISTSRRSPTARRLPRCARAVTYVRLSDPLVDYIVDVIRATREHPSLEFGASTRAANMLASAVRAFAVLEGRDFVIPDDVKVLALPVLRHRLTMSPSAEIEGLSADRILREGASTRRRRRDDPAHAARGSHLCRRNSAGALARHFRPETVAAVVQFRRSCPHRHRNRPGASLSAAASQRENRCPRPALYRRARRNDDHDPGFELRPRHPLRGNRRTTRRYRTVGGRSRRTYAGRRGADFAAAGAAHAGVAARISIKSGCAGAVRCHSSNSPSALR